MKNLYWINSLSIKKLITTPMRIIIAKKVIKALVPMGLLLAAIILANSILEQSSKFFGVKFFKNLNVLVGFWH